MTEFDEIRPYSPDDLPEAFGLLCSDPAFIPVLHHAMPGMPMETIKAMLHECRTNDEFQKMFIYPFLKRLIGERTDGVKFDCASLSDKRRNYTFISNHRDICLDPAFLSKLLIDADMKTVEIAIGDNLLIYPWIKTLVRINKAFIVKRGLALREQLAASQLLARYMHYAITVKHENLWIAQRQGRAKDSDDRTQDSILKMLAMGGEGSFMECLTEMNLVPLSISYEYDPCDYLKAQEAQQKRDMPDFHKTMQDDLLNMQQGMFGYKGRVCFRTASCLNGELQEVSGLSLPKHQVYARIAALIDKHIHTNYEIYPCNRVALDMLEHTRHGGYTEEDKVHFERYLEGQIAKINLSDKDIPFLLEYMLKIYANPLKNHLEALKA